MDDKRVARAKIFASTDLSAGAVGIATGLLLHHPCAKLNNMFTRINLFILILAVGALAYLVQVRGFRVNISEKNGLHFSFKITEKDTQDFIDGATIVKEVTCPETSMPKVSLEAYNAQTGESQYLHIHEKSQKIRATAERDPSMKKDRYDFFVIIQTSKEVMTNFLGFFELHKDAVFRIRQELDLWGTFEFDDMSVSEELSGDDGKKEPYYNFRIPAQGPIKFRCLEKAELPH